MLTRPSPGPGLLNLVPLALLPALACRQPPASLPEQPKAPVEREAADSSEAASPAKPGASVREPACVASLAADGRVLVDGKPTGLPGPDVDLGGYHRRLLRVRSFAWDEASILLALGSTQPWGDPFKAVRPDILWQVPCAQPEERSVKVQIQDADFSWAALSEDGSALDFTLHDDAPAQRFDFAADSFSALGTLPKLEHCWLAEEPMDRQEFVVERLPGDALLVYNGGFCGFEAEFEGRSVVIEDPGGAATRRPSGYVGPVAVDPDDRLWLGNGGLCAQQETVDDHGEPGLWRSEDRGETWTHLPLGLPKIRNGVAAIWTAADDPEQLLAQTACCYPSAAEHCDGGEIVRSEDGGASWDEVTLGAYTLGVYDYDPEALHVGPRLRELEMSLDWLAGPDDGMEEGHLRSADGGRTWAVVAQRAVSPSPVQRSVELDGWVFEATVDGLRRREAGKPADAGTIVLRPGL